MLPTLKACGNFCMGEKEEAGETGQRLGMLAVLTEDPPLEWVIVGLLVSWIHEQRDPVLTVE